MKVSKLYWKVKGQFSVPEEVLILFLLAILYEYDIIIIINNDY